MLLGRPTTLPPPDQQLRGRDARPFELPARHAVLGTPLDAPVPDGYAEAHLAMGCFWGAEEIFWQTPGVWSTAVGYAGGGTPNPTYEEVCTGLTGHTEVVRVVFDPAKVSFRQLLRLFWENHDPTQGFRQGNDLGTQYRSAIYWTDDDQHAVVEETLATYQQALGRAGLGTITTEVLPAGDFYYAEPHHQQYLAKVPNGYRCHANTGVPLPA